VVASYPRLRRPPNVPVLPEVEPVVVEPVPVDPVVVVPVPVEPVVVVPVPVVDPVVEPVVVPVPVLPLPDEAVAAGPNICLNMAAALGW
jgi:signal-induced proliferation-associated 1 like protein 3